MKFHAITLLLSALVTSGAFAKTLAVPTHLVASVEDRVAIDRLLATYTRSVSTKDRVSFEALLLDLDIPFAYIPENGLAAGSDLHGYAAFRRGVFDGPAFTQQFRDIHISQDGPLANVTLMFINTPAKGPQSWGWKTLQLLKASGRWKIASEFYTVHP